MTTTLLSLDEAEGLCSLQAAYTQLILEAANADSSFSFLTLTRHHGHPSLEPLHRGTVQLLDRLSATTDEGSLPALTASLRDLHEAPWITEKQVGALLELSSRLPDTMAAAAQALPIAIAPDGSAQIELRNCKITRHRDWWVILLGGGEEYGRCLSLEAALAHARIASKYDVPATTGD